MRNDINEAFRDLEDVYKLNLTTEFKRKVIHGVQCATYSCQKHWTSYGMKRSSQVVGLHREVKEHDPNKETIDFDLIMTRTYNTEATPNELLHMKSMSEIVAERFRSHGECKNSYLDSLGIACTVGAVDRDDLEAWCRRDPT